MCCLLLWRALVDEKDAHKEEMATVTAALNNNTQALIHLADKFGMETGGKHLDD